MYGYPPEHYTHGLRMSWVNMVNFFPWQSDDLFVLPAELKSYVLAISALAIGMGLLIIGAGLWGLLKPASRIFWYLSFASLIFSIVALSAIQLLFEGLLVVGSTGVRYIQLEEGAGFIVGAASLLLVGGLISRVYLLQVKQNAEEN
jgi:hypothetical protein